MDSGFWVAVAVLVVQTAAVLIAARFAIRQLREATRTRALDGFLAISYEIASSEAAASRKLIYTKDFKKWSDDERHMAEEVCVTFDRMGVLVLHGLIPEDVALSMYFDVILRTWKRLEPFVKKERERRQMDLWMMRFERLAEKCEKHWMQELDDHREEWKYLKKENDIYKYFP
jgi:hypothetical protein